MSYLRLFVVFLLFVLFNPSSSAQDAEVPMDTEHVRDQIYVLSGQGGNIAILKGEASSLMIDSKFPAYHPLILNFLKENNAGAVKFLLNTNFHYDHISGNELFGKDGAIIIMHECSREQMLHRWVLPELNPDLVIEPWPEIALPTITVKDEFSMYFNGQTIEATHFPWAHSDGDLVYYFKESNVMHTGDIIINFLTTFINISSGGSIHGVIDAIEDILKMTNTETLFIPGHGPTLSYAEAQAHLKILIDYRSDMQSLIDEGMTFEEVKKNPPAWGEFSADNPDYFDTLSYFAGLIFHDLTGFYKK